MLLMLGHRRGGRGLIAFKKSLCDANAHKGTVWSALPSIATDRAACSVRVGAGSWVTLLHEQASVQVYTIDHSKHYRAFARMKHALGRMSNRQCRHVVPTPSDKVTSR